MSISPIQIKQLLLKFPSLPLLFEDEVPNTYPVSFINSWPSLDEGHFEQKQIERYFRELLRVQPSSLYIGIPFCQSQKCLYCVYRSSTDLKLKTGYIASLSAEMAAYSRIGVSFEKIKRIYVGGGTPSILDDDEIKHLFQMLRDQGVPLDDLTSFCFELAPLSTTKEKIELLIQNGVSRFSLGVQDLNEEVIEKQNRASRVDHIHKALSILQDTGIYFNVDLIYGLPGQNDKIWRKSIETLLYQYHVPEYTFYRMRVGRESEFSVKDSFISLDERIRQKMLLSIAAELLAKERYDRVRPCHWVSKPYKSQWKAYKFAPMSDQHAQNEQRESSQLGIGADAISHVDGVLVRNRNAKEYNQYWGEPGFRGVGKSPDFESYFNLSVADHATRNIMHSIEESGRIVLDDIPIFCSSLREFFNKKEMMLLFTDSSKEDIKIRELSDIGLLLHDYIESLIVHECTKFQERVRFSTPIKVIEEKAPKIRADGSWEVRVAAKIISTSEDSTQPLKIVELGAGVGALSLPVIKCLIQCQRNFRWDAYDIDPDKIQYYRQSLAALEPPPHAKINLLQKDIEMDWIEWENQKEHSDIHVVFMPSFLNHIVFKSDCLRYAWHRLRPGGVLVLGWPDGAWAGMELGPSWRYDEEGGEIHRSGPFEDLWRDFFRAMNSWQHFFETPLPDWGVQVGDELLRCELPVPTPEILFRTAFGDDFSLEWERSEQIKANKKAYIERADILSKSITTFHRRISDIDAMSGNIGRGPEYIWRFLKKLSPPTNVLVSLRQGDIHE